jgi:hypothetical protein
MSGPAPPTFPRRLAWLLPLAMALVLALALPHLHPRGPGSAPARADAAGAALGQPPPLVPRPLSRRDRYLPLTPLPPTLAAAPRIQLGVHLENAYNLSIADQTFMADGWYWLRWPQAVEERRQAADLPSERLVQIVNNIASYDLLLESDQPRPERLADGSWSQLFRFSGMFYIDDLNLRDSPFNQLSLPLFFEVRSRRFSLDGEQPVLLVPAVDTDALIGAYASIKGYQELGADVQALIHRYPTDFGTANSSDFAMTELRVFYRTPWFTSFLQWLMPLLIVMAVVFLAPSLEASLGELRLAIPSTALLTLVVMQQTYQSELPPLPYLTFLDKIYGYCYLVSIALFVLFVWGANTQAAAMVEPSPESEAQLRRRIDGADRLFQVGSLIGAVVVVLVAGLA